MSEKFNLEIISPEKILIKDQVSSVTFPSFEGEMTVLLNHVPLITFLRPGIVRVFGAKETKYFIEEGTVEFSNNNLIILSSTITDTRALSKDTISKMIAECKDKLSKGNLDDKMSYVISHKVEALSRISL